MNAPATGNGNGHGLLQLGASLLAPLSLALALLVAVQPGGTLMFSAAALAPVLVIHYWTMNVPFALPLWLVFATGLLADALSQGPLGYSALLYVASYELSRQMAQPAPAALWWRALALAVNLSVLTLLQVLVVALYAWHAPQFEEASLAAVCAALTYPAVTIVLTLLARPLSAVKALPS
jgi:rod shape-determining protein MreD